MPHPRFLNSSKLKPGEKEEIIQSITNELEEAQLNFQRCAGMDGEITPPDFLPTCKGCYQQVQVPIDDTNFRLDTK